ESIVEKSIKIVKDSSGLVQVNPDPKTKNLKSVRLFPNPTSGRFTLDIELNTPSEVMIRVYNVSGISKEARLLKGAASYRESFDLKDLPNGVYSLILQNGSESQVVHFIIQK
ncbi:MAG: T9SS type A sorting domain-containing protein, partial [Saprospiraceae bacterium]|nr:T9SS type A sorting domain-containing protein [Saprospiraceae bacterium]